MNNLKTRLIVLGVIAAAVAGYYFYSKDGKKHKEVTNVDVKELIKNGDEDMSLYSPSEKEKQDEIEKKLAHIADELALAKREIAKKDDELSKVKEEKLELLAKSEHESLLKNKTAHLPNSDVLGVKGKGSEMIVERFDPDYRRLLDGENASAAAKAGYLPLNKIEKARLSEEVVKYVYVSRGAWVINLFEPFIDKLGYEAIKSSNFNLFPQIRDVYRSYARLCKYIASDDNSEEMKIKIMQMINLHRDAIANLRLAWGSYRSEYVDSLFNEYLAATLMQDLDKDKLIIPAGTFKNENFIDTAVIEHNARKPTPSKIEEKLDDVKNKFNK